MKSLTIGIPLLIVVVDDQSVEMTLVIDTEATFYDAEFHPVTLEAVKVNATVNFRYNTVQYFVFLRFARVANRYALIANEIRIKKLYIIFLRNFLIKSTSNAH